MSPHILRAARLAAMIVLLSTATLSHASELHVGGATISITPQLPVALDGQMITRVAHEVETECTATALALESRDGDRSLDQTIAISCDLLLISDGIVDSVRQRIKERIPDFAPEKLFVSATHTHTAPVVRDGAYDIPPDVLQPRPYLDFLADRLAEIAVKAWESRRPGSVGWGLGNAVVAHNRRSVYADGTAVMYGPTDRPDFRGFEFGEDHDVNVLCFWDADGKLIATAINVACPSQEVEGRSAINADFWHPVREKLREKYGDELFVLAWNGASGDQSPHLRYRAAADDRMRTFRDLDRLEEIARRIVAAWEEAYEGASREKHADAVLVHRTETIELPAREVTDEEYARITKTVDELSKEPARATLMRWHQDAADRYERQQAGTAAPYTMELHAVRLGDVALATNDFELYTEFGMQMKARSKALQTFVIQLAGPGTYVPTQRAKRGGGYSAVVESSVVGPEGGQVLADKTVELVNILWGE